MVHFTSLKLTNRFLLQPNIVVAHRCAPMVKKRQGPNRIEALEKQRMSSLLQFQPFASLTTGIVATLTQAVFFGASSYWANVNVM